MIWSNLLCLAPALLLVALMLLRRYPGERLIVELAARRRTRPRRRALAQSQPSMHDQAPSPRGGLLMGFALAVRPPPLALALS